MARRPLIHLSLTRARAQLAALAVGLACPLAADQPATNHLVPARSSGLGFTYSHDQVPERPWSIQIARISRSRTNLTVLATLANDHTIGLATVSQQMQHWPVHQGRPLAAINGDYFTRYGNYAGDPEGLHISNGEVVSAPNGKSTFWIDATGAYQLTNVTSEFSVTLPGGEVLPVGLNEEMPPDRAVLYTPAMGESTRTLPGTELILEQVGGRPWTPFQIGETYAGKIREIRTGGDTKIAARTVVVAFPARLGPRISGLAKGGELIISLGTLPNLRGTRTAITGGPALLRDGRRTDFRGEAVRHPRTAIAWNRDDFYFIQVDGRQPQLSVGMTLVELADYLQKLGCTEALNLDGGGSSTLWAGGQVMNNPSEGAERPTGNGLVLVLTGDPRGRQTNQPVPLKNPPKETAK